MFVIYCVYAFHYVLHVFDYASFSSRGLPLVAVPALVAHRAAQLGQGIAGAGLAQLAAAGTLRRRLKGAEARLGNRRGAGLRSIRQTDATMSACIPYQRTPPCYV